jgi:hypothetical protein
VKKPPPQTNAEAKNYPLVAYFMRISCLHFSVSLKVKLLLGAAGKRAYSIGNSRIAVTIKGGGDPESMMS